MSEEKEPRNRLAVLEIAHVAHDAHEAFSRVIGEQAGPLFHELAEDAKKAIAARAEAIITAPGISAYEVHENWKDSKEAQGWKPGEIRDEEAMTHPNLVRYSELPPLQQVKAQLFISIVRQLAKKFGFQL